MDKAIRGVTIRAKMSTDVMDSLINNNENMIRPIISLKLRVIVPAGGKHRLDRAPENCWNPKGKIKYPLIEDLYDIKAGIALNEKIAGLGFPDSTGMLDLNRVLKAVIQYSASGVKISCTSLEQKRKKSADVALPKSFNLQKRFSSQCRAARESRWYSAFAEMIIVFMSSKSNY
jgi:hypothetical protein